MIHETKNPKTDPPTTNTTTAPQNPTAKPGVDDETGQERPPYLKFKLRNHSLRLPASQIAALSGFNPHALLPKILLDLVYQGSVGASLLRHDAALLGITISSDEEILKGLVRRSGSDLLESLLRDSLDETQPDAPAADALKRSIRSEAVRSGAFAPEELRALEKGVRHAVDTGFGTAHEDDALDLYEKKMGWDVRERNTGKRCWSFEKAEDVSCGEGRGTVIPVGPATEVKRWKKRAPPTVVGEGEGEDSKKKRRDDPSPPADPASNKSKMEPDPANKCPSVVTGEVEPPPPPPSFFSILGAIDGIRDEIWWDPSLTLENNNDKNGIGMENDGFALRRIVIECKHRMRRAFLPPPLYDQIQVTVYCMMYGCDQGEIVQVVRSRSAAPSERLPRIVAAKGTDDVIDMTGDKDSKQNPPLTVTSEGSDSGQGVANAGNGQETLPSDKPGDPQRPNTVSSKNPVNKPKPKSAVTEITTSRISLDDPLYNHKQNFFQVILPRIRSFVEAVYSIRSDDGRRYQLLILVSEDEGGREPWEILFGACPWLIHCDTAFRKEHGK